MKSNYKLAIAMLAGAALGAAAAQGLHAQTKPLAYVISENDVNNKEAYAKEFVPLAVAALKDSGQKQLAAGGQTVSLSGEPPKSRIVLSVFENIDKAKGGVYVSGLFGSSQNRRQVRETSNFCCRRRTTKVIRTRTLQKANFVAGLKTSCPLLAQSGHF